MSPLLILFLLIGFQIARAQNFLEQPKSQHVTIGSNVTFSCIVEPIIDVSWYAYYSDDTFKAVLTQDAEGVINRTKVRSDNRISTTLTLVATQSWNGTIIRCYAEQGHGYLSDRAYLMVYSSLRPLPPSHLNITTITSSILLVSWSPTLRHWEHYDHIDYYNISIARKGSSTSLLSTSVESTNLTINFSDHYHPPCTEFEFNISAVSREYGESNKSVVVGGFNADTDEISQELSVITNIYFRSNGSPIVDIIIQLPTRVCSYQNVTVNGYILSVQGTELIRLEPSTSQGPDNIKSSVKCGLLRDQNYTLKVTVTSAGESSFSSTFTNFDTKLHVNPPDSICSKSLKENNKDILLYKIAIGACLVFAVAICLVFVAAVVCLCVRKMNKLKINDSTSRVCNAMVHNPIYDGPVYESVQPQFETLISVTKRGASTSNTSSVDQPCSSQPSTPTSSEKSIRYVDPPTSVQASKTRCKSFLSHPSAPEGDAENLPRSTSVSVPVIRKTGKQRNKLNLTLTLTGTDSIGTTGSHNAQNSTTEPISAVNPVVLRDVDENYTVMSPAGALVGGAENSELSPEDADKYKE